MEREEQVLPPHMANQFAVRRTHATKKGRGLSANASLTCLAEPGLAQTNGCSEPSTRHHDRLPARDEGGDETEIRNTATCIANHEKILPYRVQNILVTTTFASNRRL